MTLESAIRTNNLAAATALLRAGADVNCTGPEGFTPLMLAAGLGRAQLVELLLTAGAAVLTIEPRMGTAALHKAAQSGNADVAGLLLDHGAFIDQQSPVLGNTPLLDAVLYKHAEVVALLLQRGARTTIRNHWQQTALDLAQRNNLAAIARLIEIQNETDTARVRALPLIAAVKANDSTEVQRLLAAGVSVEERVPRVGSLDDDYTPLGIATREGFTDLVGLLLAAGADPRRVIGLMGGTPVHEAAYFGYAAIVRELTQPRKPGLPAPELDAQGAYNGFTALHDAVWHGHLSAAQALVQAGARLDLKTHTGLTPRGLALLYGYEELAEFLADAERDGIEKTTDKDHSNPETSPVIPTHEQLVEQVARFQTSHEIDKLLALFAEDILFEDVALGIVANGHAEVKEMFEKIYASMPDYRMTLVSAVADKERGRAEWLMSGTHLGDFPGLPASGKPFSLRVAAAMRFSDGRISHWTDYWSVLTFKEQVGLA